MHDLLKQKRRWSLAAFTVMVALIGILYAVVMCEVVDRDITRKHHQRISGKIREALEAESLPESLIEKTLTQQKLSQHEKDSLTEEQVVAVEAAVEVANNMLYGIVGQMHVLEAIKEARKPFQVLLFVCLFGLVGGLLGWLLKWRT